MNYDHDHEFERLITGSLASRSGVIGDVNGSIDDVLRRVDFRRGRRRHVAAFGATAMLAVGAFAMTAIGSSDPTTVPLAPADSHAGFFPDMEGVWRCTGPVAPTDDQGVSYFAHCEYTTIDGTVPTTEVPLILTTTTTIVCPATSADTPMATMPCTWAPPPTVGAHCSDTSGAADVTVPCGTAPVQEVTHRVQSGDTLTSISDAYGIPVDDIVGLNEWGGRSDVTLVEGDTIVIALTPISPTSTVPIDLVPTTTLVTINSMPITHSVGGPVVEEQEHIVVAGDSLHSIAEVFGVTLEQLVSYNQFDDGAEHLILPGDRLLVPPGALAHRDGLRPHPPGGSP